MYTYAITLPFDGAIDLTVYSPTPLTDEQAIDAAMELPERLTIDGKDCEIAVWQMHTTPVNRGNICHFLQTHPEVECVKKPTDDP